MVGALAKMTAKDATSSGIACSVDSNLLSGLAGLADRWRPTSALARMVRRIRERLGCTLG